MFLSACKRRLAILWFVAWVGLVLVLVVQSVLGKYGDKVEEAWAWFLPSVMPTLLLIVGVLVVDFRANVSDKKVTPFMYRMTFGVSAFYLLLVALVPLLDPFTAMRPLEMMKVSNLWLGPVQGVAAAALGAFFIHGERELA